jgi:uroporphyrinogen decarboxylase
MNSRERVLRAINFKNPDRIPIDLGSTRASGLSAVVYDKLKRHLGIHTPTKALDSMQVLAEVELEVLDRIHADVVPLEGSLASWCSARAQDGVQYEAFPGQKFWFAPGTRLEVELDGSKVLLNAAGRPYARMPRTGYYFDFIRTTMSDHRIDPKAFQPVATVPQEELEAFARRADFLYRNTDKAILGWGASISMFGLSALLSDNITQGSLDDWLCMLMVEKAEASDMMARATDAAIERLKLYHQAAGDRITIWGVASDDAGTQRGPLIQPDLFREMILPHYKRFCSWTRQHTPYKTYLHSCGSVYEYIADWIEAGIDILNPVQISAANMDPQRLARDFGGKIVFWGGGCDTQKVLPQATPPEVREHVRRNIQAFSRPDGGFVFNQVHNIQLDVPIENVEVMLQAAWEFGKLG